MGTVLVLGELEKISGLGLGECSALPAAQF